MNEGKRRALIAAAERAARMKVGPMVRKDIGDIVFPVIVDAILAELGEPDDKWRTIDSAPKDGTRILLHRRGWEKSITVGKWRKDLGGFYTTCCTGQFGSPTHWQPIPDPPTD